MSLKTDGEERRWLFRPPKRKATDIRRVKDPEIYDEAPDWYIADKVDGGYNKPKPINLTRDVAGMDQGGDLYPMAEFMDVVNRKSLELPEDQRAGFRFMQQGAREFVRHVDLDKVCVGNSPVERAINYLQSLSQLSQGKGEGTEGGTDELPQEFGGGGQAGREMARKLNEAWDQVSKMSQDELDDLGALSGKNYGPLAGKGGQVDFPNLVAALIKDDVVELLNNVARNLRVRTETTVKEQVSFTEKVGGSEVKPRRIRGAHEIKMLSSSEKAMLSTNQHMGMSRIAKGESLVLPRGVRITKKQFIYVIVDVSGSMFYGHDGKEAYRVALALLRDRIQYALDGQAIVYLSWFADRLSHPEKIDMTSNPELTKLKVLREKMQHAGVGGGTDISHAITNGVEHMRKMYDPETHSRPDILLVTDGESSTGRLHMRDTYDLDGRLVRINTFFITEGSPSSGTSRAIRDAFDGNILGWDYQPDGHAMSALTMAGKLTGGGLYYISPTTIEPLEPHKLANAKQPWYTHNPYSQGW